MEWRRRMASYFNAKKILPSELIAEVLGRIPEGCRSGALVYFSEDYYARRNAEIERSFQLYATDTAFGSHLEIYEALSEQYGLTVRQICKIVKGVRERCGKIGPKRRRYSGVRVGRTSRRMSVRTTSP
jgi:hypothetical protein